eukprot:PhM_4_TR9827/c0_g1_i1/m.73431
MLSKGVQGCDAPELLALDSHEDGAKCDPRTLIPLQVPQGAYFAHWLDGVMPRLVRALALEPPPFTNIVVYIEGAYLSSSTTALVNKLGLTLVHSLPGNCFRKIIWTCRTVYFEPTAARLISDVVRKAFAEDRAQRAVAKGLPVPAATKQCTTRVYAARLQNVRNERRVANEAELCKYLNERYNFKIFAGSESLDEWAEALDQACVLMGSHGGALAHLFWLDRAKGPVVIELDGFSKYAIYWFEAAILGIRYAWQSFPSHTGVEIGRLDALLAQLGIEKQPLAPENAIGDTKLHF